ncbi:MAG TPA: aminoacyl-tRNA hydrolase [Candidatus Paceibacterota bacterium]|nr:aminoacyl-tRNA hydrolase [Candidatus Paceibacterota bacterium]
MKAKLIIGLGNPGLEYEQTRHNIGLIFIDFLAKKTGNENFNFDKKLNAQIMKGSIALQHNQMKLILAKPESYVNTSGSIIAKLKSNLKVKSEDIIIVHDDLDIPFGNTKLSFDKNSGGHRGIESIMKALKTKKFYRLRIGTQTNAIEKAHQYNDKKRDELIKDFVLSKFSSSEHNLLKQTFVEGLDKLISLFNQ